MYLFYAIMLVAKFADRLMVGLQFLVLAIGVRIPVRELVFASIAFQLRMVNRGDKIKTGMRSLSVRNSVKQEWRWESLSANKSLDKAIFFLKGIRGI